MASPPPPATAPVKQPSISVSPSPAAAPSGGEPLSLLATATTSPERSRTSSLHGGYDSPSPSPNRRRNFSPATPISVPSSSVGSVGGAQSPAGPTSSFLGRVPSGHGPPGGLQALNLASPQATRASPIVPSPSIPSSPSLSRPTSPKPFLGIASSGAGGAGAQAAEGAPTQGGLLSPSHSHFDIPGLKKSESQADLNHIFERDVEFNAAHVLTPHEAMDVAVAPVLDEAAVALSSSTASATASAGTAGGVDDTLATSLTESLETFGLGSGWSSRAVSPTHSPRARSRPSSTTRHGHGGAFHSLVAARGEMDSPSPPLSAGGGQGLTSPESTAFSLSTPSSSPPTLSRGTGDDGDVLPESLSASTASLAQKHSSALEPFPSSAAGANWDTEGLPSLSSSASATTKDRRLSFISYADIVNEERLSELTGEPLWGSTAESEVHQHGAHGGGLDLETVLGLPTGVGGEASPQGGENPWKDQQ